MKFFLESDLYNFQKIYKLFIALNGMDRRGTKELKKERKVLLKLAKIADKRLYQRLKGINELADFAPAARYAILGNLNGKKEYFKKYAGKLKEFNVDVLMPEAELIRADYLIKLIRLNYSVEHVRELAEIFERVEWQLREIVEINKNDIFRG